jgi:hypothetical protein
MSPKRKREGGLMKHCETGIHNVPMTAFSSPIMLRSVGRSSEMINALSSKIVFKFDVLTHYQSIWKQLIFENIFQQ